MQKVTTKIEPQLNEADAENAAPDPLIPNRYPQHELFICDVADAILKDVIPMMEHPFYSLSKKPETTIRRYEHNGHWIEITPSVKGLATIYDKDILIYCISQIMANLRISKPVSKRVRINSHELLMFTNRGTAGKDYSALVEALDRLEGTRIRTNIVTGDEEQTNGFGLIDASAIRRKHGLNGRLLWCDITLSEWVFNAIRSNEVLALHRDYFRLRKPIERRIYELARKHCGQQKEWKISVSLLHKKTGSKNTVKEFRRPVRELTKSDHLPDYHVTYDEKTDMVEFTNRHTMKPVQKAKDVNIWQCQLNPETFSQARDKAPGWDIYVIEQSWRLWLSENKIKPTNPDCHFLKFCESWFAKRGCP
jgi:plasmid replication initiation protein